MNFTDQSRGTIDSWEWNFGDGAISTDQSPIHIYEYQDTFTVSLTVTGPAGTDTMTKTDYISVVSSDNPDLTARCREFHTYDFGAKIVVKVEVVNTGNDKAGRFKVSFYLSDSGFALGQFLKEVIIEELLDEDSVMGGLKGDQSRTVSCRYESETPLSGKYVDVRIDSDDQILETNETNNRISIRIP